MIHVKYSGIAQSVEQLAVNQFVVGSSPSPGEFVILIVGFFKMPITKSAKKAMNRAEKLAKRNKDFKLRMKMAMKKFIKAIEKGEEVKVEELSNIYKAIDKCLKV